MKRKTIFFILLASLGWSQNPCFQQLVLSTEDHSDLTHIETLAKTQFQGEPISKELLNQIRNLILADYQNKKRPFVLVDIPDQDVTSGTVRMNICESTLACIESEGNRWFRSSQLAGYIRLKEGEPIDSDLLLNDLSFANRNPFRTTSAYFKPGPEKNTTQILLSTQDRFPLRLYAGGDNTGNDFTGNARWFAGLTAGNLWLLDHTLSYQYTTTNDLHRFQSHTAQYQMPIWGNNLLSFFGGVSFVHADLSKYDAEYMPPPTRVTNKGFSAQASGRLQFPLGRFWDAKLQELWFGFDFKRMNNNLIYIGDTTIPLIFRAVNLGQFMNRYFFAGESGSHRFSFENNIFFSPGELIDGGNNSAFNNLRDNAKNRYGYGRISLQDTYQIPSDFRLFGVLRGQWASGALLPSEQMGLGGYDTVRGYDEREFNADQAIVFNGEVHTPNFHFLKRCKDAFFLLAFADFAAGWNYSSLSNEESSDWLGSVGAGFRYHMDRYLDARLDYGFKLHKDSSVGTSLGKLHVGLIASY